MPYLEVNQRKLHFSDTHQTSEKPVEPQAVGRTLLFIHGLGSSQNYYYPILPWLLNEHRCITIDTYGAGRSQYTGQAHSVQTLANDAIGVLDRLNIDKAVIVGHSMGGMVVSHLAATFPERVEAVVAIGPVHPTEASAASFAQRIELVEKNGLEPLANTVPTAATGSRSTSLQRAFIRELLLGSDPAGYMANCRVIAQAQPPNYAAVNAPYLFIAGDEDKSAPLDGVKYIYGNVGSQSKTLEVLAGVGHWHCIEASDEVGKLISVFLSKLASKL